MARSGGGRSGGGASRSSSSSFGRSSGSSRSSVRSFSSGSSRSGSGSKPSSVSRPSSGGGLGLGSSRPRGNTVIVNNSPRYGGGGGGGFSGGYGGSYGGSYRTQKRSSGLGKTLLIILLIFGLVLLGAVVIGNSVNRDIPVSTIERQALPLGVAQGEVIKFRDDTGDGDWFDNRSVLVAGATKAYNLTGVKFGIIATRDINGNINPTDSEMAEYADALYQEWFPDDEAHVLIVILDQPHRNGYHAYFKIGITAQTVFDAQAVDVLDSYLYKHWVSTMTTSEVFSKTITDTSERIMTVTPSTISVIAPWLIIGLVLSLIIGLTPVIVRMSARKKQAEADLLKAEADILSVPIAGLDGPPEVENELVSKYLAEAGIPHTPTYKPPENPLDDPYTPKPAGYAAQQAAMGYPKAPPQKPVIAPDTAEEVLSGKQKEFKDYQEFKETMRGLGFTDNEVDMYARYKQYKKVNNLE